MNASRQHAFPVKVRLSGQYGPDATPAEAVTALRGAHPQGGHHHGQPVYVVRVWPEEVTVPAAPGRLEVTYKAGEPAFGQEVTVYPQEPGWDGTMPARVHWQGGGSVTTAEAVAYVELIQRATGLAQSANQRTCARCAAEIAARNAKE